MARLEFCMDSRGFRVKVTVDRKNGNVTLEFMHTTVYMPIGDAYILASDLLRELDNSNPLLREPE